MKLTPSEQATVNFYKGRWKKLHKITEPFTLAKFSQFYNTYNEEDIVIPKASLQTYFSKVVHKHLNLIQPIVDEEVTSSGGVGSRFWIDASINFHETALGRKLFPMWDGRLISLRNLRRKVEECVLRDNIELTYKAPYGYARELESELSKINSNIKYDDIIRALRLVLAKHSNLMPKDVTFETESRNRRQKMKRYGYDKWIDFIEESRMTHDTPKPEYAVNDAIIRKIMTLPQGGAAILIGTQGAIMAPSKKLREQYNHLCCCNLVVGGTLAASSSVPLTNVVGDAVDPDKSDRKFILWQTIDISKNWNNIQEKVDEEAVMRHVSFLAERHNLVKVVIMNSGSIKGYTMVEKGLTANFERAARKLVKRYPHVHIIAMQMLDGRRFGFRYFHQNTDTLTKT